MGLVGAAQVGVRDDLDEGDAAPVEVDAALLRGPGEPLVEQLPGVLLHVDALESDATETRLRGGDLDASLGGQRPLVLRDLVPLGQVRIEVVLPREDGRLVNVQCVARAALSASVTAWRFRTGSAPGSPRQTGQTLVLGSSPNRLRQPQNSFVAVRSWQWTSRPMTGS